MDIKTNQNGNILTITIDGNIDSNNALELLNVLIDCVVIDDVDTYYINLSCVYTISSSGIGKLLTFYKAVEKKGKSVEIHGISNELYAQFEELRMDIVFPIKR